ncbi:hypothetical protein EMCRGX_G021257 [Ephydatia muelleri]
MSHHAEVFHTDPLFCPFCGTILPLGNVDFVECRLCWNQQKFLVGQSEEYSCRNFAVRKDAMSSVKKGEGPLVDRRCARCGHEQMTYSTQQTRSADEGQTVFYCCPQCQFQETENS